MNEFTPFQNAVLWFAYLFGMAGVACLMLGFWYLARRQKGRPFLRVLLFIGANLAGLRLVYLTKRLITGQSTELNDLMTHALVTGVWLTLLSVYGLSVWVRRRHPRKMEAVKAGTENVMEDLPIAESRQGAWPVTTEETSSAKVMLRQSER
jgi:peptidoglycan biosynthesis protein MviN/MurJ (putative lipid II flippase)